MLLFLIQGVTLKKMQEYKIPKVVNDNKHIALN